jgi:hypothetical protein
MCREEVGDCQTKVVMIGGMKLVPSEDQHVLEMKAGGHRAFE